MARSVEQQLAAIRTADVDGLRAALRSGPGIVVATVTKRVVEERQFALVPDLVDAFERLLEQPLKRDPGCRGKIAIGRALHELDRWDDRVFVVGLRVTQPEGWDEPRADPGAELRGICGLAHAHFLRSDALDVLAGLLADPHRTARLAAAQGLGDAGRIDATALLRYKLLVDDKEDPEVLGACFASLFALARTASTEFAIAQLGSYDDRAEAAAIALGSARISDAAPALIAWADACQPEPRHRVAYVALALLRCEPATAHLLDAIRTRSRGDALAATRALATFKVDATLVEQLRAAIADVTDRTLRAELAAVLA